MKTQCTKCGVDTGGVNCPQHPKVRIVVSSGEKLTGQNDVYEIQKVLSDKGGTALTYLAQDSSGNMVVVKELIDDPDPTAQADNEIRFEREAVLLQTLSSKFLPKGLDRFDEAGHRFFVQTYIPGTDLFDEIDQNGKMSADDALEIGVKVCEALGLLHDFQDPTTGDPDPILHRDIKPDNIMLTAHTREPVLIDFGSAAKSFSNMIGATVNIAGTPGYISQSRVVSIAAGGLADQPSDDLFSLAYTLIYLVTGVEPKDRNANRDALIQLLPPAWRQYFNFATQDVVLPGNKKGDIGFRPKNWQDFRSQLISLMSPAKAASYTPATALPTPVVSPPAQNVYSVDMQVAAPFMPDAHSYCEPVQGRILLNGHSAGGLLLTPIIFDVGGKSTANGKGTGITTGNLGDFTLVIDDCTVPLAVDERQIELVFTDSAGVDVHKLQIQISRPKTAMAKSAGSAFFKALQYPFDFIATWRTNRARVNSAVQLAGLAQQAQIVQVQGQAAAAKAQAKLAKLQAKQVAKQRIAQQRLAAQQAPDYVSPWGHIRNFLKPLLYIALALGAMYVLYQLGVYAYAWLVEVDWKVWGWFIAKIVFGFLAVALALYLIPKIYRFAKAQGVGGWIKTQLFTVWGMLKTAPNILRGMVAGALLLAACIGLFQNQLWLILFPLGLLPLCYKYKSAQGWTLAIIVSFTAEAITLAVCLSQIRQFLNWLGG